MEIIRSKTNPTIKSAKKLLTKKYRKTSYLIEGWHLLAEARQAKATIERVFVVQDMLDRVADMPRVTVVTSEVLKELTDSPTPQGVVAEVRLPNHPLPETLVGKYLVLEDVQDPGNVGTIIRTADAAGFDGVFLTTKSADLYNAKTLRAMQGSHFHLPIWRLTIEEILAGFKKDQLPVLATTLSKDSVDYKTLPKQAHFALVMGNEGNGISEFVTDEADYRVHITMPGQAESLNVAVAAGVLIFSLL